MMTQLGRTQITTMFSNLDIIEKARQRSKQLVDEREKLKDDRLKKEHDESTRTFDDDETRKIIQRDLQKGLKIPKKKKGVDKNPDIYVLSLKEKLYMIRMGVQAVVQGYKTSRLYTGTPGIGKTMAVREELDAVGVPYVYVAGGLDSTRALYQLLYDQNDSNLIIVFDDVNNILKARGSVEILRAAVTNDKERRVTFSDNKITKRGDKKYYPHMIFRSKIIIITNIPKRKIDPAIISRTSPIEIIADKYEIAEYVYENIEKAPPEKAPLKWKKEVWDYLMNDIGLNNIRQFDFRIFEDAVLWRCASKGIDNDWKKHVSALVL